MNKQYLWVIEIKDQRGWLPTVGCGLTRFDARRSKREWEASNPDDKFRIKKYIIEDLK